MLLLSIVLLALPSVASAWCEAIPKTQAATHADAVAETRRRFLDPWQSPVRCEDAGKVWMCATRGTCEHGASSADAPGLQGFQLAPDFEGYYREVPSGREYRCDAAFGCRPTH